jgi:hypothetical protein
VTSYKRSLRTSNLHGESNRDKFMATGQQTAVSGETIGIYLFRNPTENRKVGGSTPPLATRETAGHKPVTCVFVLLSDWRSFS